MSKPEMMQVRDRNKVSNPLYAKKLSFLLKILKVVGSFFHFLIKQMTERLQEVMTSVSSKLFKKYK